MGAAVHFSPEGVTRLRPTRTIGITVLAALLLAGCAFARSRGATILPEKRCGQTPQHTIARLFDGIIDAMLTWSFAPVRFAIAEGENVFGVFGGGDRVKGWRVMLQLYRHPEVLDSQSEVGISRLESVGEPKELGNGETRVLLEREDVITVDPPRGSEETAPDRQPRETTKVFRRAFAVRLEPGTNCITAVRPIDPSWTRIK